MSDNPSAQRFGSHLSVAGGLHLAFETGHSLGCDCLQIFVKNQRQWSAAPLREDQVVAYREAADRTRLHPVVAHASYLINLASPDRVFLKRSRDALVDELKRCHALGVGGLVVHPGAHMGRGVDAGIKAIAKSVIEVLKRAEGCNVRLLLETTAGQGSSIGHEIEHLGRILGTTDAPPRLGICLDTCHLFAAGYNLTDAGDYERMMEELTSHVGIERIHCIHVNDSKRECGSRVDRHEHIGKGCIGRAGFARLINDPRLKHVPRILETPKGKTAAGSDFDRLNLRRLRRMIAAEA